MKLRPNQTIVVSGRLPGDPPEYYEVHSFEGDGLVWCRDWCPHEGCFIDQLVLVRRADILRLAHRHDRLPVYPKETALETSIA